MTLRADLYTAAGAKRDVPPLVRINAASHSATVGKVGEFSIQVPAATALNATSGRLYLYDDDKLIFRGVIRQRQTQVSTDGVALVTLGGPSISDELLGLQTGRGLIFEEDTLSSAIGTLVTDTTFTAGDVATATVKARRFDDRTRWDALAALAQAFNCSLREDLINGQVDINVFGDSCGIVLRQVPAMTEELAANPYIGAITGIRVQAQSVDLCTRVIPWGQAEGLGGLQFGLGSISTDGLASTRLYLDRVDGAPPIAPAFDSTWEATVAQYWDAGTERGSNAPTLKQTGTTANDNAIASFVYGPLGEQTIQGNVTGQFIALESNAACNATLQMLIKVVSSDGLTVRGTALAHATYGNEAHTSARNLTFPSTALTPVDAEAGDYLVVELGFRKAVTHTASIYIGNSGTQDLPVDETTTDTTMNPWIEFDQNIALGGTLPSGAAYPVTAFTGLGGETEYGIQDDAAVALHGVRVRAPKFKDVLPLGLTVFDFAQAAQLLYGMAVDYLVKHKEEQTVYEVDVVGLTYLRPDGQPYFQVGDTFRLQYQGRETDATGETVTWLDIDRDLYLLGFTHSFAGEVETFKLQLSTFLRVLPSDGEILTQMARDIGIEQVAPVQIIQLDDYTRFTPEGVELVSPDNGDDLVNVPLGTRIKWFRDSFRGVQLADVVAGYSTPGASTLFSLFLRAFADTADGANAKVGVWNLSGDEWNTVLAVQDVEAGLSPLVVAEYPAGVQTTLLHLSRIDASNVKLLIRRAAATVEAGAWQGDASTLTIATGAITVTSGYHFVDTEAAAATDDLDTINGGVLGMRIVLQAANSARTVSVTETGNIELTATPFALDNAEDTIELIFNGTAWCEIARANNGA